MMVGISLIIIIIQSQHHIPIWCLKFPPLRLKPRSTLHRKVPVWGRAACELDGSSRGPGTACPWCGHLMGIPWDTRYLTCGAQKKYLWFLLAPGYIPVGEQLVFLFCCLKNSYFPHLLLKVAHATHKTAQDLVTYSTLSEPVMRSRRCFGDTGVWSYCALAEVSSIPRLLNSLPSMDWVRGNLQENPIFNGKIYRFRHLFP